MQGSVGITLDNRLAVASESVNGGSTVALTHDADDHLIAAGELTVARDASTGLPASTALGVVSDTGTHDAFGELTAYSVTAGGTPLFAQSYDRDKLGRIARRVETVGGETTMYDYTYDSNGQLVEVTRDGDPFESYGYDANGNRISANVEGESVAASYDDQDRLLAYGAATFEHTPSGRIKTRTAGADATAYEHDAAGNFVRTTREVIAMVESCPFEPQAGETVHVVILDAKPDKKQRAAILSLRSEADDFAVVGREIFNLRRDREKSVFSNNLVEKTLGMAGTTRNFTTIKKLAEKYS